VGKPDSSRSDSLLIGVEKTTKLVTTGVYRHIRHPIYSSGLYVALGVFFKHTTWLSFCLTLITVFFLTMTARMEEAENIRYFGSAYQDYMKKTRMFVPFLF
jgi:protein-S-isoprenylcysteine O-methyltransferase Ste14